MKKVLVIVLALIMSSSFVYAENDYGVLTGTVTISQPAPAGGIKAVVVVKDIESGSSSGGSGSGGGKAGFRWPEQKRPDDEVTDLKLNGKREHKVEIKEGETSATYSFTYDELVGLVDGKTNPTVSVAAYLETAYGMSSWTRKTNIGSLKNGYNVTEDISVPCNLFYSIGGKIVLSPPCAHDEVFTIYAVSDEFVAKTSCTCEAGQSEAQYSLNVISGQEYEMQLYVDIQKSFYKDTVRGTKFAVENNDIKDVNFYLTSDFKTVHGTLMLPEECPAPECDQTYKVRLSSASYWLGEDVITLKKGTRSAEFLIPVRTDASQAILSWGLGDYANDFYSNGELLQANVAYPIVSSTNGEIVSSDPRQCIDIYNQPENIVITPRLENNKTIDITCEYGEYDKYDEITDQYSGKEKRIKKITLNHSVPLPEITILCAYDKNGKVLCVAALSSDKTAETVNIQNFVNPGKVKTIKIYYWNGSLKPTMSTEYFYQE
ncbi:MAG: hypothetical protein J5590_06590 [Clostridia bacterium]|nr:hypothetical protein [Clostridia bacterium]